MPSLSNVVSFATASAASGPCAEKFTFAPRPTSSAMIEVTLLAFACRPPIRRWISLRKLFARFASTADGRACKPSGLGMRIAWETTRSAPFVAAAPASLLAMRQKTGSCPAMTMPAACSKETTRSEFAITTGVSRLFACVARKSRSNSMRAAPVKTWSPRLTLGEKPWPLSATVSRPTCISTWMPSAVTTVIACPAGCSWAISPSHGARRMLSTGSIAIPSPTIFSLKTGSGTLSRGTSAPLNGAMMTIRV